MGLSNENIIRPKPKILSLRFQKFMHFARKFSRGPSVEELRI